MTTKTKVKEGNGASAPGQTTERKDVPDRVNEPAKPLARTTEHPLSRLRDEIDSLFGRFFGGWSAPLDWGQGQQRFWDMDVQETDREILVRAEAPGFEAKDFDIHVSGNTLTISAEHKEEAEQAQGTYRTWERRYGRFQRSVPLPAAVNADQVEATYRNGVLELRLPRAEEARRRRIEVKS